MLTAFEITQPGTYRYYEWVGGAPQRVTVRFDEGGRLVLEANGRRFDLKELPGLFEGPLA